MDAPPISADDLMDVIEMTDTLEKHIGETLKDNQGSLALSALMNATINSMMSQCKTLDEVVLYRNVFVHALDTAIKGIQIKNKDQN